MEKEAVEEKIKVERQYQRTTKTSDDIVAQTKVKTSRGPFTVTEKL